MAFDFGSAAAMLRTFATVMAVIMTSYAGFVLATSRDVQKRNEWKEVLAGIFVGISLLYLAPLITSQLMGGTYCG